MATIKQNILLLAMAFAGLWGTAQAQTLSVNPITVDAGAQTELCVNIEGATSMTALQFNLAIPEGFAFKQNHGNYGIELGAATAGHTLSVSELSSGELLVVLYNMNLNTFKDGTLLTLPLVAGAEAGTSNGALSKVRMATTAAESNAFDNVNFSFQISVPTGISGVTTPSTLSNTYYDLQGRKVAQPTRGIYIFNGKKVIK